MIMKVMVIKEDNVVDFQVMDDSKPFTKRKKEEGREIIVAYVAASVDSTSMLMHVPVKITTIDPVFTDGENSVAFKNKLMN